MSVNKFIGPSVLLFLDQSILAAINWLYWVMISKVATTSEIGHATTIYNLVLLVSTLTSLGLEYPLLKKAAISGQISEIVGTTLIIELVLTLVSVPIIIYIINNVYEEHFRAFTWIALAILVVSPLGFVARFVLLAISNVRSVLIADVAGVIIKLAVGFALVSIGYGAYGILISFLLQALVTYGSTFLLIRRKSKFKLGNVKYFQEVIREGLVNTPSKLSRMLIVSLSVVLLASFGISSSQIGLFYIALMVSIVVGSFTSSMAYMVIPASSAAKIDLSSASIRIGLSLTVPLVAMLISSPRYILGIIGAQYIPAGTILSILSIGILPSAIVAITISKFNYLGDLRKLLSIGSIQIISFLVAFYLLVPTYGSLGAAISILIGFIAASVPSVMWSERILIKYIMTSCVAIVAGAAAGYGTRLIVPMHPLAALLISVGVAFMMVIVLRNTSTSELRQLIEGMIRKT